MLRFLQVEHQSNVKAASASILMFYYIELEQMSATVWAGVVALMAYPHLLFFINRWYDYPRKIEFFGLIFDMFLIGWISDDLSNHECVLAKLNGIYLERNVLFGKLIVSVVYG